MPTFIAEEDIPRTNTPDMDGADLTVLCDGTDRPDEVIVSDGERFAIYIPLNPDTVVARSAGLAIVPAYTEAGRFREANIVTLTDGRLKARYIPYKKVDNTNRN